MRTPKLSAAAIALALLAGTAGANTGCATGTGYPGLENTTHNSRGALLHVTNNNWHDMRVYVVTESGRELRLGMVTSMNREVFRVRPPISYGITRIVLRPIGTRASYVTNTVLMRPGTRMILTVQNQLTLSDLIVRN